MSEENFKLAVESNDEKASSYFEQVTKKCLTMLQEMKISNQNNLANSFLSMLVNIDYDRLKSLFEYSNYLLTLFEEDDACTDVHENRSKHPNSEKIIEDENELTNFYQLEDIYGVML